MQKRLKTLPITMDADKIAEGMLEMFTDDERVVLRFGMLPFEKMQMFEKEFEASIRERFANSGTADELVAVVNIDGYPRHIEFSMKKLVQEASRKLALALYSIGDLVV